MARQLRRVMTLAGPVAYIDSGWTEWEWRSIEAAMARCTGVGLMAPDSVVERARESLAPFDRSAIERAVASALKMTIDAHGPIRREHIGSAAKRVVSLLKEQRRAGRG